MNPKYVALIVLVLVTLFIVYLHSQPGEPFATKRIKAQKIYDWFRDNPEPNYSNYKKGLNNRSNIVEYEDVLALFKNKNLTVESVEKII